ncbi:MAG: Holliday junction resolvase RuvX [Lewinellaceae bacterium]|nr:Holliday junction resolvase RuvX [Lewinellaceae bacterium]
MVYLCAMGRWMAIDYGSKRSGIAVTDPLRIIASGLTTVPTGELLGFLESYLRDEQVDRIVLGDPYHMNGDPAQLHERIHQFGTHLSRKFKDVRIDYWDERLSSERAREAILQSGAKKKKRQDKALVDQVSAGIILLEYLEYHEKQAMP